MALSRDDIGHPISVVWFSCIVSLVCSIYQLYDRGHILTYTTCIYITIGFAGMLAGAFISRPVTSSVSRRTVRPLYIADTSIIKKLFILAIFVYTTWMVIHNISLLTSLVVENLEDMTENAKAYRNQLKMPFLERQIYRVTKSWGYYLTFIIVHQIIHKKWDKTNIIYIACFVFFAMQKIISGGRSDLMYMTFSILAIWSVERKRMNKPTKISGKLTVKVIVIASIVLLVFGTTRTIFGRSGDSTLLYYLTNYMGGSIFSFDRYVAGNPLLNFEGRITFGGLYRCFAEYLGIGSENDLLRLGFITINGMSNGNTYTSYGQFYADFGVIGIFLLSVLYIFIFIAMYRYCCTVENARMARIATVVYSRFYESLFLVLYGDHFFGSWDFGTLNDILSIVIIDYLINTKFVIFSKSASPSMLYSERTLTAES